MCFISFTIYVSSSLHSECRRNPFPNISYTRWQCTLVKCPVCWCYIKCITIYCFFCCCNFLNIFERANYNFPLIVETLENTCNINFSRRNFDICKFSKVTIIDNYFFAVLFIQCPRNTTSPTSRISKGSINKRCA